MDHKKIKEKNLALINIVNNASDFENIKNEIWFEDLSKRITESHQILQTIN